MNSRVINWILIAVISLSPPGAALVQSYCNLSGTAAVSVALVDASTGDACSDRASGDSHASCVSDCCRTTVLSRGQTLPVLAQPADVAPVSISWFPLDPDASFAGPCISVAPTRSALASRTLPLLI